MITLKLTNYSYLNVMLLRNAFIEAQKSIKCPNCECIMCYHYIVCSDISNALRYIDKKADELEISEPDPPSDCF